MTRLRTYSHLSHLARKPSAYDIATTLLLYHPGQTTRLSTPTLQWLERHGRNSPLRARDWERFRDPRQTTYSLYTQLQRKREIYVDGLLQSIEDTGYDEKLGASWVGLLEQILPPLRFPLHGLQMISAGIGHLAPSGRIAVAALLQTADEIRRIQRIAYRMRQIQLVHPSFGQDSRERWERDPLWQPLRKLIEQMLVVFDWGEALVALQLCLKPSFDPLFTAQLGELAERNGDPLLKRILLSFEEDCRWHREWTRALLDAALEDTPDNSAVISEWQDRWQPRVTEALAPLARAMQIR